MINPGMRYYDYFTLGENDEYGMAQMDESPKGQIKMNINIASQSVQDNINYTNTNYVGLTYGEINDKYIIKYGEEMLKVLYVNPIGRKQQVFLQKI